MTHNDRSCFFHFSFGVKNLEESRVFYCDTLGCERGRYADSWFDINFFGHQVSLHQLLDLTKCMPSVNEGAVESVSVPLPHFGVILESHDYEILRLRILDKKIVLELDLCRYQGCQEEQKVMFLRDPSGHAIEFKCFRNPSCIF
ncbi:MAG: VOC family protein [Oligoflexales bacterium]